MAQGKVQICGVNTAKLPVLKEEEKEALIARIKAGDAKAKEEYIKGNLRLVLSVIKRFGASNENPDDLFQIGCIGLIKAINNFNTELDVKFSTYAVPMIIGEIRRYMRDNNSIRVSRSLRDTAYKAIYAKENFMKRKNERDKEEKKMFIDDMIDEAIEKGKTEGKAEGKAEDILDLLEEYGTVHDKLKTEILKQTDLQVLKGWLKLAARVKNIDEFIMQTHLQTEV